ncbi:MAG: hypothetical protein RLZ06_113 [Actinomycetota bacterium]|jgi:hypothetical protein
MIKPVSKCFASALMVISVTMLSACSGGASGSQNVVQPTPSASPLFVDSSGWDCDSNDTYGTCNVATYDGASTPEDEGKAKDFAMFQFICQTGSEPSMAFILAQSDMRDKKSRYTWNPETNPKFQYSIDQGPRKSTGYDITAANGRIFPDSIDLLDAWPGVMRDIADAKTLQIWITDSTGTPREIAFNVEDSVSAVANLSAWGYNCQF